MSQPDKQHEELGILKLIGEVAFRRIDARIMLKINHKKYDSI